MGRGFIVPGTGVDAHGVTKEGRVVSHPSEGAETDVVHDAVCLSTIPRRRPGRRRGPVGGQAEGGGDMTCMPW